MVTIHYPRSRLFFHFLGSLGFPILGILFLVMVLTMENPPLLIVLVDLFFLLFFYESLSRLVRLFGNLKAIEYNNHSITLPTKFGSRTYDWPDVLQVNAIKVTTRINTVKAGTEYILRFNRKDGNFWGRNTDVSYGLTDAKLKDALTLVDDMLRAKYSSRAREQLADVASIVRNVADATSVPANKPTRPGFGRKQA